MSSFHGAMFLTVGVAVAEQPWFWAIADAVALTLLFLNVLVLVAVHARRLRQYFRTRRAKQFHARVEEILGELDPATRARDPQWLRTQIGRFDELERPIAATMLIERVKPASEEERLQTLAVLREAGAVDSLARSTARGAAVASRACDQDARLDRRRGDCPGLDRAPLRPEPLRA